MAFTAEDLANQKRKLENRINSFSGKFMSDAKWLKVFKLLSTNSTLVTNCYVKLIWGNTNKLEIPAIEDFTDTFTNSGIKDVMMGGPSKFKEIKSIEFPATWQGRYGTGRQDLNTICQLIDAAGKFEIEVYSDKLILYGYR